MHTDDDDIIFTMMAEHEESDQTPKRPMLHACLVISQAAGEIIRQVRGLIFARSLALKIKNQDQESRRAHTQHKAQRWRGDRGRWPALDIDVEKILDLGSWILDLGSWILDLGSDHL